MSAAFSVPGAVPMAEKQKLDDLRIIPFKSRVSMDIRRAQENVRFSAHPCAIRGTGEIYGGVALRVMQG